MFAVKLGFKAGTVDILVQIICCKGWPLHHRGLAASVASTLRHTKTPTLIVRAKDVPWGQNHPRSETTAVMIGQGELELTILYHLGNLRR